MSKDLVTRWFQKLPSGELDLPLLLVSGYAYTPRTAYDEVQRDTALGAQLQALIESGRFGTSSEDEIAIAKARLQQIWQGKPDTPLFHTLSNKSFTPSQLLQEIQDPNSTVGQQWIQAEISRMTNLVRIR